MAHGGDDQVPPQWDDNNPQLYSAQTASEEEDSNIFTAPPPCPCRWHPKHTTYTTHPINPDMDAAYGILRVYPTPHITGVSAPSRTRWTAITRLTLETNRENPALFILPNCAFIINLFRNYLPQFPNRYSHYIPHPVKFQNFLRKYYPYGVLHPLNTSGRIGWRVSMR